MDKGRKIKLESKKLLAQISRLSEAQLLDLVRLHNKKYFIDNEPEISDEAFDMLVETLKFTNKDSPVLSEIGFKPEKLFGNEVRHQKPMLSLDKCYDEVSFFKWADKIKCDFMTMPKIDGVATSIIFNSKGEILRAATRGDGKVGEDITNNILVISDIPKKLLVDQFQDMLDKEQTLEVRGEVYLSISRFENPQIMQRSP